MRKVYAPAERENWAFGCSKKARLQELDAETECGIDMDHVSSWLPKEGCSVLMGLPSSHPPQLKVGCSALASRGEFNSSALNEAHALIVDKRKSPVLVKVLILL